MENVKKDKNIDLSKPLLEIAEERSLRSLIFGITAFMGLTAFGILWISAPADKLLGQSPFAVRSAFHGLFAGLFMITSTIGLYQAFRLWGGSEMRVRDLQTGSLVNAALSFLTVVSGNWIYVPYRGPGGPRIHFLETIPEVHKIFFEFKEFAALFTLPLTVAAAFVICRYGDKFLKNRLLRDLAATCLSLAFFYFVMAFGLGAAITKLKSV